MKSERTVNGQLRPLEDRMSKKNLLRRAAKVEMRKKLGIEYAKMVGIANFQRSILTRGLFGRLRWAFFKK